MPRRTSGIALPMVTKMTRVAAAAAAATMMKVDADCFFPVAAGAGLDNYDIAH